MYHMHIVIIGTSELKWKHQHLSIVLEYSWKVIYEDVV